MATAAERTEILQMIVGMVDAAPGADILAELEAVIDTGVTMQELATAIYLNPVYSGDNGLFPDYLPNEIFATQFLTQLLGTDVSTATMTAAVEAMTALLNADLSRGEAMYQAIVAVGVSTDADYADATAALANKVTVSAYYSVEVAQSSADLDDLVGALAGVDSTAASVTAAEAAIDAGIPPVPFDIDVGVEAIEAADAARDAFLTAEATTAGAVGTDAAAAVVAYDAALNAVVAGSSAYATDTAAAKAAALSAASGISAADLADTQAALTAASGAITAIAGLTEAIAADTAADAAVVAATAAAAATDVAANAASASWVVNSDAGAKVDTSTNTAGVLTVTVDDGTNTPFADDTVLTLTAVSGTTGQVSLAAASATLTAAQLTTFTALQAGTGVAELIATFNADESADDSVVALTAAAAATQYSSDFLDLDAASIVELTAIGGGFTVTTAPTVAADTTEAQIAGETAGHAATVAATAAVAVGTAAALVVADAADAAADASVVTFDGLVATYDAAVAANAATTAVVDSYAALTLYDAAGFPAIGGGTQAEIIAADAATQVTVTAEDAELDAIVASTAAAQAIALASDNAAILAAGNATTASGVFAGLVAALDAGITVNPAQAGVAAPTAAVAAAQAFVDDIDDGVADLATTAANVTSLAALDAALAAAIAAFGTNGYSTPNDVDGAAEFGTALDDIFVAGTIDSDIYNFNLQGDDLLYVGTDAMLNTTDIGSGAGQTALAAAGDVSTLEIFLAQDGSNVDVVIETKNYGSETGDYTTITLIGAVVADVSIADGILTVA